MDARPNTQQSFATLIQSSKSDYTKAPACSLLATHCACCGRALLDAISVESGIGPDCATNLGIDRVPSTERSEANELIHRIATIQKTDWNLVKSLCEQLTSLGFVEVASKITSRLEPKKVKITIQTVEGQVGKALKVIAPYNAASVLTWQKIPGRRFIREGEECYNLVPVQAKRAVLALLQAHYKGVVARGDKGVFVI